MGVGQHIEVPLLDAMFPSIGHHGLRVHEARPEPATFATLWGGFFECKDGRWLRFGGSGNQNFRQFVEASGIESWDKDGLIELERVLPESAGEVAQIQGWIRELFRTRTAQEWEDLIAEAGSEGAVCRTSEEWFDHPHARESEMVVEVEDRERGSDAAARCECADVADAGAGAWARACRERAPQHCSLRASLRRPVDEARCWPSPAPGFPPRRLGGCPRA